MKKLRENIKKEKNDFALRGVFINFVLLMRKMVFLTLWHKNVKRGSKEIRVSYR